MKNQEKIFGLIGKNLSHSFSKNYFEKKWKNQNIEHCKYQNFEISDIQEFPKLIDKQKNLVGLNITIPYKKSIIQFLDELDETAQEIQAVNCISIEKKSKKLKGYNTDCFGFEKSFLPLLQKQHQKALILGTGGAAKAVAFVLKKNKIDFCFVSRKVQKNCLSYFELNKYILQEFKIIINTTPLGMHPKIETKANIPYQFLGKQHLLYDLVYNPLETAFLKMGKEKNCITKNGLQMLEIQAEKGWIIWN